MDGRVHAHVHPRFRLLITSGLLILGVIAAVILYLPGYILADEFQGEAQVVGEMKVPNGYRRLAADDSSYAVWLRRLPLKEPGSRVLMYNGLPKPNQRVKVAVLDLDIGESDLQQCADAAIRLRADYLFMQEAYDQITFHFTSGDECSFRRWIQGYLPQVHGNNVSWQRTVDIDSSEAAYHRYLETVFTYAGSYSLSREMARVTSTRDIMPGDLFVQGGFPGHVVIVVDIAQDETSGNRIFLLAQGFTPAQDIHILTNPSDSGLSPWYRCDFGDTLITLEWTFTRSDLMRWKIEGDRE